MVHLLELTTGDLACLFLATYYLTILITQERGPGAIFAHLRKFVGMQAVTYIQNDNMDLDMVPIDDYADRSADVYWKAGDRFWSRVLSCHRCTAPYMAVVTLGVWFLFEPAVLLMAMAGSVVALKER